MLKGCQKQMVVLRGTGSEVFEEAYFILKNKIHLKNAGDTALLLEANKLLEENRQAPPQNKRNQASANKRFGIIYFLLGLLLGVTLSLISFMLLSS